MAYTCLFGICMLGAFLSHGVFGHDKTTKNNTTFLDPTNRNAPLLGNSAQFAVKGLNMPMSECLERDTAPSLKNSDALKKKSRVPKGTNSLSRTTLVLHTRSRQERGGGYDSDPGRLENETELLPLLA